MTPATQPKVFGTGLIALDLVIGPDPETPVRSWSGGTCGNVLSILAWLGWDAYPIARMNGDVASERVCADMARWGVHLDWTTCAPTTDTPIIVQEIRRGRDGRPRHRFSWSCPICGKWLPPFKAITVNVVERIKPGLADASVFFLDRLSRATLTLAAEASALGAVVVFEPSGKATDKLMAEAIALAHVVKYADERLPDVCGVMTDGSAALLEVQTLAERGLKYRHRLGRGISDWIYLQAVPAPRLADTCGSGDWCTAGLIAKTAVGGEKGLRRAGARGVRAALRYGQALAAWNCGFEGARGGMYSVPREAFESQITSLLNGRFDGIIGTPNGSTATQGVVTCPACPPAPRKPRGPGIWSAASPLNVTPSNTYGDLVPLVDDAIERTQVAIDPVQVSKRDLMQELLTRSLPGRHTRFKRTEIGEIPEGWTDLALADIATVVGGGTPTRSEVGYWDGDVPWATPTDVTGLKGRDISETASTITSAGLANSSAALLPPFSLLMTTRATIGACAINRVSMATNQGFQSLVPKQNTCVDFLYYLIHHHKRRLERLAAGSTFLEVSKRAIRGFRVPAPPVPEQRKIAAILSSVDDAIEKTQAVIDQVQIVKRGLMQELLTRGLPGRHTRFKQTEIGEIPEGWTDLALADIATVVGGGTPTRSEVGYWDGDVPWATPTDVTGLKGRDISETASTITSAGLANSSAALLPPFSLLMTTRATIGACAINRVSMATNQGFQSLVPKQNTCVDFLYYLIHHHKRRLERLAAGSTFLEVSKRAIRGFRVPAPPVPEQRKIAAILSSVDDVIGQTQMVIDRAQVVKSVLTSILLAGKLRVTPDPEAA